MRNGPETKESPWRVGTECLVWLGRCEEAGGRLGPEEEDHSSDFLLKPWETADGL